jgi:streptomycin 6-kinase
VEEVRSRVEALVRRWNVTTGEIRETDSSVLVFGSRGNQPVVLKVVRNPGDEWLAGSILQSFDGRGIVRAHEVADGAALLERIIPGEPLVSLVMAERDDEAVDILADVIRRMDDIKPVPTFTRVEEWSRGFDRYLKSADRSISKALVEQARDVYQRLCETQGPRRLLHGDLHHDNVLFDSNRGWLAIDPKGVTGEVEYEIGAALRNPIADPSRFASRRIVRRRIDRFRRAMNVDVDRVLEWAFSQAVLSAIWCWEDGFPVRTEDPVLDLAREIQSMGLRV